MRAGAETWNHIFFLSRGDFALSTKKAKPDGFAFKTDAAALNE
jgi:hypothetical protein